MSHIDSDAALNHILVVIVKRRRKEYAERKTFVTFVTFHVIALGKTTASENAHVKRRMLSSRYLSLGPCLSFAMLSFRRWT